MNRIVFQLSNHFRLHIVCSVRTSHPSAVRCLGPQYCRLPVLSKGPQPIFPVTRATTNVQDQSPALKLLPNRSRDLIAPTDDLDSHPASVSWKGSRLYHQESSLHGAKRLHGPIPQELQVPQGPLGY
jgi:hypothetical protein